MEATSMTHLLKSLCDYIHWNYAVFWKLNHHLPVTLTWEGGYYGCQKANEAVESMCSDINFEASDGVFSASSESTGGSGAYSVRLLMTEVSNVKYILGEGIVGKIALKGDHCWVFCKDVFSSNFNTNLISECPYEWLLQFASGIKTIVLVPVIPHGVLQFGSFEAVTEDLAFVANIKEKFNSVYPEVANTTFLGSDIDIPATLFSPIKDCLIGDLDESSSMMNNKLNAELSGSTTLNINGSTKLYPTVPLFIQDERCMFGEDRLEPLKKANKNEVSSLYIGVSNDPRFIGQADVNLSEMEEILSSCSQWVNNVGVFGETSNGICSYSSEDMSEQQFGGIDVSFNCELYKTLGPVASGQTAEPPSKNFSVEDTYSSSTLTSNGKEQDDFNDLQFLNEGNSEYLLDAVVGNLDSASDDTSLSLSNGVKAPIMLTREYTASIPPIGHYEESTLTVNYSDPKIHITPVFMAKCMDDFSDLVTSRSFDDNSSILIDETQQDKVYGHMQSKSKPKLSSTGKKRARVGNTERPRPRDRQMIMDRMKELRELVPDGARCSIDNLLERTIKHMLYLRNIRNQAEKLKQCLPQEVLECKKQEINGSHTGTSYALDFESELQVCPLIVKDLGCSGNMLIEMICSKQGLYWEIAHVIRQMELTILKGVLESRSGTMWACFIVEVPRGFHRMDIMCPLLHLLQLRSSRVSVGL